MAHTHPYEDLRILNVLLIVALVLSAGTAGIATAQNSPGEPASFYGEISDESDTAAPVGTEVFAVVNGEVEDSITVQESGQYGDAGTFEDRLEVNTGAGDNVNFKLNDPNGPEAIESPFPLTESGKTELNLTFPSFGAPFFKVTTLDAPNQVEAGEQIDVDYEVSNLGQNGATQTIEFRVDGEIRETRSVSLDGVNGDNTASGTFSYTTTTSDTPAVSVSVGTDDDTASSTVSVSNEEAVFEVRDLTTNTSVAVGEPITIGFTVANVGNLSGTQPITVAVGGQPVNTTDLTLASGESISETVTHTATRSDLPDVPVSVSSADTRVDATVNITEPAVYTIDAIEATPTNVDVGENPDEVVAVNVTVSNTGGTDVTQPVRLRADGSEVSRQSVSLASGETTTVEFAYSPTAGDAPLVALEARTGDDRAAIGVDVRPPEPAAFEIEIVDHDSTITQNDEISDLDVVAEVRNVGEQDGSVNEVAFALDDGSGQGLIGPFTASDVFVPAGESTLVTLDSTNTTLSDETIRPLPKAGNHSIGIGVSLNDSAAVRGERSAISTTTVDYESIQSGVNEADPGDAVAVAPGTYTESVSVGKQDVVIGGSPGATIDASGNSAFRLNASGAVVSGMDITGSGAAGVVITDRAEGAVVGLNTLSGFSTAVAVGGNDSEVLANRITVDGMNPVLNLSGASDVVVAQNRLTPSAGSSTPASAGIALEESPRVLISDNTIAVGQKGAVSGNEPAIRILDNASLTNGVALRNNLDAELPDGTPFVPDGGVSPVDIEAIGVSGGPFIVEDTYSIAVAETGSLEIVPSATDGGGGGSAGAQTIAPAANGPIQEDDPSVEPNEPPEFDLTNLDVSVDETDSQVADGEEVLVGSNLTIAADITNDGGQDGTVLTELEVNGSVENSTTTNVNASETKRTTLPYEVSEADLGETTITLRTDTGVNISQNISVVEPAVFEVNDLSRSPSLLTAGDDLRTLTANVTNTGGIEATQPIELRIGANNPDFSNESDYGVVTSDETTLTPGESTSVSFNGSSIPSSVDGVQLAGEDNVSLAVFSADSGAARALIVEQPDLEVSITDNSSSVTEGENVSVTTEVTNNIDEPRTRDIDFLVNGTVEATNNSALIPNGTTISSSFRYQTTADDVGTISVTTRIPDGDSDTREVTVNSASPPPSNGGDGGGGGGGGGPSGGGGGGADEADDDAPPTVADVRSTIGLVQPSTDTTTPIEDSDSDAPGITVRPDGTDSVRAITFDNEEVTGPVNVREYSNPSQQVRDDISASVKAAGAVDTDTTVNTVSVSDISPENDAAADSSATVTLSVPAEEVTNPAQLRVFKETYDFEQQTETWETLETTVEEETAEEIVVSAPFDSFSLFAVGELETQTPDGGSQPADDDGGQDDEQQSPDDGGQSPVVIILAVLLVVAVAGAYLYTQNN